jgi:DNA-binding transcriptional ArsR family regulator
MADDLTLVWKALADPTRRRLLDLLRDGPQTTGELVERFDLSRFAVMKHLTILERAGLVIVERRGRERWNYLNAVPLQQIYDRWISGYQALWAATLLQLRKRVERSRRAKGGRR